MKRYLKTALRFILFCVIFMVILMLLSKVFVPKDNQKSAGMEAVQSNGILGEPDNTMDYLVVGDSETYSSITPMEIWRQYGYAGYVCGTGGQHLYDTERFLAQAFLKRMPCIGRLPMKRFLSPSWKSIFRFSGIMIAGRV